MDKIFKQLNNLPKHKLSKKADLKLRYAIWKQQARKQLSMPADFLVMKHFTPVAAVLVALFLIVVIPTYSYASSGVTYGHVLYPVKQTIEKVELALTDKGEAKVEKIEKFTTRRLAEAEVLSQEYSDDNQALITTIAKAVELKAEAQVLSEQIMPAPQVATPTPATKKQEAQVESLINIAQNVGIKTDDETLDKVSAALDFIKLPPGQAKKYKWKKDNDREDDDLPAPADEDEKDKDVVNEEEDEQTEEDSTETKEESDETDNKKGKRWKNNGRQKNKDAQINLETIIKEINKFKKEIEEDEDEYEEEDVEALFERLDEKVEQTEGVIEEDEEDADELIESIKALKNNGKYFIKQKEKKNKSQDEDEDDNEGEEDPSTSLGAGEDENEEDNKSWKRKWKKNKN